MNRIGMIVWLTALWLLLWRDLSVANVVSGVAIAVTLAVGSIPRVARQHRVRPLALLRFVGFFTVKLVEANLVLAREVVTPQNRIHTGIVAVSMAGYSDLVVTIVANAVSLTPGTLTLEVRREPDAVIYVHVLHLHDLDDARNEVKAMATHASRAFELIGPAPADEAVER